jgi:hypothetical protein
MIDRSRAGQERRACAAALFLLAGVLLAGCPGSAAPPPGAQQPMAGPVAPEPAVAAEPVAAPVQAVESGFTHCCGNTSYRIEIQCGGMVKRCYSSDGGNWRQTYGRHCLSSLGEACYLQDCDAKCQ